MEQRRGLRQDTDVAVRFVMLPPAIGTGRMTNISLTGGFMETTCKLPLQAVIYIEGLEPAKERRKNTARNRLAATVVRRCSAGVGLEWRKQGSHKKFESQVDLTALSPTQDAAQICVYRLEFID